MVAVATSHKLEGWSVLEYARKWAINLSPQRKEKKRKVLDVWRRQVPVAERIRAKDKVYRRSLREEIVEHYGARCVCCGETEKVFLCIDHINGGGRAHRIAVGGSSHAVYRSIRRQGFPDDFQVLCYNCNAAKYQMGICPHSAKNLMTS